MQVAAAGVVPGPIAMPPPHGSAAERWHIQVAENPVTHHASAAAAPGLQTHIAAAAAAPGFEAHTAAAAAPVALLQTLPSAAAVAATA